MIKIGLEHVGTVVADSVDAKSVVHIRTCESSADGGYCLAGIEYIECPGRLKIDGCAVFHYDKSECAILNGELIGIPVAPGVTLVGVLVELVVCGADAVFGLVVLHHPESEVERVSSDVDKRTAALLVLVEEYSPRGNRSSAESGCLCVVNIAECAGVNLGLEELSVLSETALVSDRKLLAGAL